MTILSASDNNPNPVISRSRWLIVVFMCLSSAGCVSTNNQCGNEQREWDSLHFPKDNYCSVPSFVPLRQQYEQANKAVCKVHDNNRGIASTITRSEADKRFLCDYIKRSELPWGTRHVTAYLSYLAIRIAAPDDSARDRAERRSAKTPPVDPASVTPPIDWIE